MDALLTAKAERLATEIASQAKTLDDLNGLMKQMMKSALERMLDTEMDVHLGRKKLTVSTTDSAEDQGATVAAESPSDRSAKNRRNGHSSKTVSGELGEFTLDTPRDRQGTFEPQLIGKPTGIVRKVDGTPAAIWKAWCKGCQTRKARRKKAWRRTRLTRTAHTRWDGFSMATAGDRGAHARISYPELTPLDAPVEQTEACNAPAAA